MISQTWIIGKAIRALFADRVTYRDIKTTNCLVKSNLIFAKYGDIFQAACGNA